MRNTFAALSSSLLLAGTMTISATTSADGHVTVESLKAEIAESAQQAEMAKMQADGDSMAEVALVQIQGALAERDAAKAAVVAEQNKNNFADILLKKVQTERDVALAEAAAKKNEIAFADILLKKTEAERDAALADAEAANNKNSFAEIMLKKAQNETASNSKSVAMLNEELAAANAVNAKLRSDMEGVINGRDYIEKLAADAKASTAAELASAESENAALEKKLATALKGRAHVLGKWTSLREELVGLKEKAAMAEQSDNWGKNVSSAIAGELGNIPGVEVADTGDNTVNLRLKNAGMFRTGGTNLSTQGKQLLEQVGRALQGQPDAKILVTGHTDNIPTGEGSRFKDNIDLSNQRAEVAMNHLGSATGIDFSRMSFSGSGDSRPIATNNTAEGRRMNRRVEITLSPM